jgi:hypothetical protein
MLKVAGPNGYSLPTFLVAEGRLLGTKMGCCPAAS